MWLLWRNRHELPGYRLGQTCMRGNVWHPISCLSSKRQDALYHTIVYHTICGGDRQYMSLYFYSVVSLRPQQRSTDRENAIMTLQHSAQRSICLAGTLIRHIDFLDFTRVLLCVRRILISLSVCPSSSYCLEIISPIWIILHPQCTFG